MKKIIVLLDVKYQQTKLENLEILSQQFENFKIMSEDTPEKAWDKFCSLRCALRKEKVDESFDLFLHAMFSNSFINSKKILRNEEHSLEK